MSNWVVNESGTISFTDMFNNAQIIHSYFSTCGWSINAISAIIANMQVESGINPGRWENDDVGNLSAGFGLVQWTPATKLRNWIETEYGNEDYTNGDYQIERILYELNNGLQYSPTNSFKESFLQWSTSDKKPGYLAAAFMCNYERPLDTSWKAQIGRARIAETWYKRLTGIDSGKWIPAGLICVIKKITERS